MLVSLHLICSEMSPSVLELPSEVLDTNTNTQIHFLTLYSIPIKLYREILHITEVLPFYFNLIAFIFICCFFFSFNLLRPLFRMFFLLAQIIYCSIMNMSTCYIIFALAKHTFLKDGQLFCYLFVLKKLIYKV
jgi:hypothetical protein